MVSFFRMSTSSKDLPTVSAAGLVVATSLIFPTIKNHNKTSPTDHLVMTVPGINGYSFAYDSLHILDLGVSSHICANIMFDLVMKEELPGSTQEARLKELLKRVTNLYEELGTDSSNQLRRINFSTFCNPKAKHDSFPDLTGVKARIARYLIPLMLELCQTFVDETLYKKHRLQCITCLETMYQCMENQHLHPTERLTRTSRRTWRSACSIIPDWPRFPFNNIAFSGTQCTSITWLATCLTNSGIWIAGLCQHTLGRPWLASWLLLGTAAWMALLPIWFLQRLLGGFDWGCIWGWATTVSWWILKKNSEEALQKGTVGLVKGLRRPWKRA